MVVSSEKAGSPEGSSFSSSYVSIFSSESINNLDSHGVKIVQTD